MRALIVGIGMAVGLFNGATFANESPPDQSSHSLESDRHDDEAESDRARMQARHPIRWQDPQWRRDPVVNVKLLGINDFHGQLSPRMVGTRPAGGAAVLASYLKAAATADADNTLLIHAGDHVGASPPNSALLQDEPAIAVLNLLANRRCYAFSQQQQLPTWLQPYAQPRCNVVGTPGNHEFDDGRSELLRLLKGGTHANGPFLEQQWAGARFPNISSNVIETATGNTLLPAFTIKLIDGVRVAIIGAVLKETPTIVTPTGVAGLQFDDEADSINAVVRQLRRQGIRAFVVTIHQGIRQTSYEGETDNTLQNLSGPIVDIVRRLDDDVDVVISGHAHGFTNALIPTANGKSILVTQAFSAGTAYDDIDIAISRHSGDIVEKSAAIVTTWGDAGAGLLPDTQVASLVAAADARVAPLVNRLVGVAQMAITTSEAPSGESAMGNLIADAQRAGTSAQFAFMNPGGIRTGLNSGEVTWGELFAVQPFGNDLISMDLTGAQIRTLLEQQWLNQSTPRLLKVSGLRYTWDMTRPIGDRVTEIRDAENNAVEPATSYRVTVNSFIAAGGDNFSALTQGTNRVVGPTDLNALVQYIETLPQPFSAAVDGRIVRLN